MRYLSLLTVCAVLVFSNPSSAADTGNCQVSLQGRVVAAVVLHHIVYWGAQPLTQNEYVGLNHNPAAHTMRFFNRLDAFWRVGYRLFIEDTIAHSRTLPNGQIQTFPSVRRWVDVAGSPPAAPRDQTRPFFAEMHTINFVPPAVDATERVYGAGTIDVYRHQTTDTGVIMGNIVIQVTLYDSYDNNYYAAFVPSPDVDFRQTNHFHIYMGFPTTPRLALDSYNHTTRTWAPTRIYRFGRL